MKKRLIQNERNRQRNVAHKTRMKSEMKKFTVAIEDKDLDMAQAQYKVITSLLDKGVTRNLLHRNKAARIKSRFSRRLKNAETGDTE